MLSKEEREELLNLGRSRKLREDFRTIRENHSSFIKKMSSDLDSYIEFLTIYFSFSNHPRKPFRKIEGKYFRL